ncbi:F-box/LRR-repeat protein [Thalictrum thalictroides]|uniref:F-box/LRR-repeat protein n=1 Tax=Thalictrum thalictroides TaxID=46969 RepID=A0A7J6UQM5_THATH|nr:F-box/LRR-repeat protein [Thalictrum thalictroides]
MSRSGSGSKKSSSSNNGDIISNLPIEILHQIASFLDLKSIYRVSLVSKRWEFLSADNYKYLFQACFPYVNFSFLEFPFFYYTPREKYNPSTGKYETSIDYNDYDGVYCSRQFIEFEQRLFFNRHDSSPIHKFSFSCQTQLCNDRRLYYYIKAALNLHVQEIYLSLSILAGEQLYSSLFTYKALRVLELRGGSSAFFFSLNLPETTVDLPSLKHLHLENVTFNKGFFSLSNCPLLKTLVFKFCSFGSEVNFIDISSLSLHSLVLQTLLDESPDSNLKINISVPNLMYFRLSDCIDRIYSVENLIAPAKADLDISMLVGYCMELNISTNANEIYAKRLINYLQALKNVQALTLGTCFLRILSEARGVLEQLPVGLYNLRCLKLKLWLYQNCIPAMLYLLQNAPNVETLVFETRLQRYWSGLKVKVLFWYEDSFDSAIMKDDWEAELLQQECMLYCLKTVEIRDFLGCEEEIRFLKFLLKTSKALEKINLIASEECHSPDIEEITTKISETLWAFPRASSNFDPEVQRTTKALAWVRFPKLGQQYWEYDECIMSIAKAVGCPIGIDKFTMEREFGYYANVLIDLELSKSLPNQNLVEVEDDKEFIQDVVYPVLPNFCAHCQAIGHLKNKCKGLQKEVGKEVQDSRNTTNSIILIEERDSMTKKKKKAANSIEDLLEFQKSKLPRLMNCLDSRVSRQPPETRKAKRVRFEDTDIIHPLTCNPNACLNNASGNLPPKSEDPKTSEFALYRKFREDAGHHFHSYQLHKQDKQLEKSEACNRTKELTKKFKPNYVITSLSPKENVTPLALVQQLSPQVSMNSAPELQHKDIFSIKRQKLLHLAAKASFLDIDKLGSKRHDLVSMLLQRLVPKSNRIAVTNCSTSKSNSSDTNFKRKSQRNVSLPSNIHFEEVPQTQSVNLISPYTEKRFKTGIIESRCMKPTGCNFSQEVGENLGSLLTWHPNKINLECEISQPNDSIDYGGTSTFHAVRDSSLSVHPNKEFPVSRDGYLAIDYMSNQSITNNIFSFDFHGSQDKAFGLCSRSSYEELDDLCFPNELASDRERYPQFLGWGTNSLENEQDFFTSCGAAPNTYSTWRMPSEDNLLSLNCILDASGMHSPSTHDIYHCSDITLQNMSLDSDIIDANGRQSPAGTEYQVEEADDFPLTLGCTPKYRRWEERCRLSSLMEETSIFHSPLTKSIVMRRIVGERAIPSLATHLQSIPDVDDESDGLQACDYLKELQLSICSDLQVSKKDARVSSSFLLLGDSLSNTEDQIQLAEDLCCYDLTSLTFRIPSNSILMNQEGMDQEMIFDSFF